MPNLEIISQNLKNTLNETNIQGIKKVYRGKVRDMYEAKGQKLFIITDRQSAFDRVLASVPFKGAVLNLFSAFWFEQTKDIVDNHMIAVPDPNVMAATPVKIYPVEVVVRAYITGSTSTSAWMNYEKGERLFCGVQLPEGLKKNQKFNKPILTPTTKSDEHDEKISRDEIIAQGLVPEDKWNQIEEYAFAIFKRGQEIAAKAGYILVDTKYEFGEDANGNILLADEVHTPDSSRYWKAATYEERFSQDLEPESFDKEFLRLWFREHCDPYNDEVLPDAPDDLVIKLSSKYIEIYEQITGNTFEYNTDQPVHDRIQKNIDKYLKL